ncbi:hypothetical protein [Chryseobacterium sp.]|uniref:hypothetical protein n=1 Tax=Chryseobacterium sp. TaxID=1871047 RepID=UPI000EEEFAD4|nr:hypothetical protein [Chryseobacterium sp.]HCM34141.1 hypothetical protein [Chryseobacterium sp.]
MRSHSKTELIRQYEDLVKRFKASELTEEDLRAGLDSINKAFMRHTESIKMTATAAEFAKLSTIDLNYAIKVKAVNHVNPFYRQHQNKRKWK